MQVPSENGFTDVMMIFIYRSIGLCETACVGITKAMQRSLTYSCILRLRCDQTYIYFD